MSSSWLHSAPITAEGIQPLVVGSFAPRPVHDLAPISYKACNCPALGQGTREPQKDTRKDVPPGAQRRIGLESRLSGMRTGSPYGNRSKQQTACCLSWQECAQAVVVSRASRRTACCLSWQESAQGALGIPWASLESLRHHGRLLELPRNTETLPSALCRNQAQEKGSGKPFFV